MVVACYGIYQATQLPIDAVPDITNNQVQIITIAPSFGATDIERLVTFPIEQANTNINGMKEIRSFSRFGLSLVTVVFNDDIDIYWARQQVAERLQKVKSSIPKGIGNPELGPISTGLGEIYQYVVRPKLGYESRYDETELRTIQDWVVRRQLLGVEGVAEVSSFGGKLKQYEILVNSNKLQSYNVTINDVFNALEKNNQNTGGAYIEKGPTVLYIRTEGLIGTKEDIGNISIKTLKGGNPLFIRDVAEVNIGHATRYGAMCYNDQGEVSGAVVMMMKGANSSAVIKNVKKRIVEIQKILPEGVVIEPFLDRTKMVNNAIGTVEKNLIEGALIVIFILVLFLGNLRAGLLVASMIPLSMLIAIILMNLFGVSGNLMSLGALDFGLIVDGAVIIVEAVMHQLSIRSKKLFPLSSLEMDEEVNQSANKMMNSAVFGQVIIFIVYLPIFTLQGIEGKMFKPMAQTVAFALIGAFILSITYIPMMSSLILSRRSPKGQTWSDKIMHWIESVYERTLLRILRIPKTVLGIVFSLFILSIFVLTTLGGEFIPALEEGDFAVDTRVLTGSNLNTTIESTQKAAHILKSRFPEVEKVVTKIGSGEVPTDPMPMEASDMMVILKDKSEWTSAKTFDELASKMHKALEEVPGITTGFQYPVQMRFNELMTGARQDVVCKIFGENLDTLAKYATQLGKVATEVKGSSNIYIEPINGMPQIIINYNRAAIAQYNLNIDDINRVVNTAFAGQSAGEVFEGEKRFNLVVKLNNDQRKNLEDVQNVLISTPQGTQVPLYQLANVEIKQGINQIQREDAKRRIVVGLNVRGSDVQTVVSELQKKIMKDIKLPPGYYITYGGAFENLNAAKQRLMVAVPVSLILIFVLLFFAFNSVRQGLLIYTAIPLSTIGGILFLWIRGMPFSISAGVGFIALFGVAVLNGIVLIAEFNRLRKLGYNQLQRVVIMGTKVRLRPVLMTACVASLGFLPMALSNGAGAAVQRPLATVLIGGLLVATFLTLFVLPILYIIFENKKIVKIKIIPVIILAFIALSLPMNAEQNITLPSAIDSAIKNNLDLKQEKLKSDYDHKMVGTFANIPKTNINLERGQINSFYTDNRYSITQSFNFPLVYARQKSLLNKTWQNSLLNSALKTQEIKRAVTEIFYSILVLREKEKLLLRADSNYAQFLERSNLRYLKGESNVLEKTTAEMQRGNIYLQLTSLQQEIENLKYQLQFIMNTNVTFEPVAGELKVKWINSSDTGAIYKHPAVQILNGEIGIAQQSTKTETSRLFPDIIFGYYKMSMQGTGADNKMYNTATQFNSAQIGIGVPLFFGEQSTKIKASKIKEKIAENALLRKKSEIKIQYAEAVSKYQSKIKVLEFYEQNELKNAIILTKTALKQFSTGEINYLEWVILNNQSIIAQSGYFDAIKDLNDTIILLNYLNSNQ